MKAIGYTRVSTDGQVESGLGLEAQEAAIRAAAAKLGVALAGIRSDPAVSGGAAIEKRVGLLAALEDLSEGDVLLVAKRDRIGRQMEMVLWVEKEVLRRGARIVSAAGEGTDGDEEDPSMFILRRVIDMFAEFERRVIRYRTRAALQAKRARGEALGNTPFGYCRGPEGMLVPSEDEQRTARMLLMWASEEPAPTWAELVRRLAHHGLPPRVARWNKRRVVAMLRGGTGMDGEATARDLIAGGSTTGEVAAVLNERGISAGRSRWTRGQVRRLVLSLLRRAGEGEGAGGLVGAGSGGGRGRAGARGKGRAPAGSGAGERVG